MATCGKCGKKGGACDHSPKCGENTVRVRSYCRRVKRRVKKRPGPGRSFTKGQLRERLATIRAEIKRTKGEHSRAVKATVEAIERREFVRAEANELRADELESQVAMLRRDEAFTSDLLEAFQRLPLGRAIHIQDIDAAVQRKLRAALLEAREEARDRYALYLDQRHLAEEIIRVLKADGVDLRRVDAFERFDNPAAKRKLAPRGGGRRRIVRDTDLGDVMGQIVREFGLDARLDPQQAGASTAAEEPATLLAQFLAVALESKATLEDFSEGIDPVRRTEIEALEREALRLLKGSHDSEEEGASEEAGTKEAAGTEA